MLRKFRQAQTLSDLGQLLDRKTLSGIFHSWLYNCFEQNYSDRTFEHYEKKVGEFLGSLGPDITKPKQITDSHIKFFLTRKAVGHEDTTVHGYHRAIHTYFSYMVAEKIIKVHPMVNMKPPKVEKKIIQPYKHEEICTIINYCDNTRRFTTIRNKALFLLYISTGLRRDEMTNIELPHVDISHRTIRVNGKGDKWRIVGFGARASKALLDYFKIRGTRAKDKDNPFLWLTEEGDRLGYWGIGRAIYETRVRLGIKIQSSTHALRHTFATQSLRNGADLKTVQALMGHSTMDMTNKYVETVNSEDAVKRHPGFDPVDKWRL